MSREARYILLAEDDQHVAELILMVLEECGLELHAVVVGDGAEALDYLYGRGRYHDTDSSPPSVVLLDLNMPRVGGLEVLRQIKHDERLSRIPVVIMTSSRDPADLDNCYGSGANAYVVKPLDFRKFKETIRQLGAFWTSVNEPPPRPPRSCSHAAAAPLTAP